MKTIEIVLNGMSRSVSSEEGTPLIYVLRNDLGLTGTKLGCGLEQCGACMVLVMVNQLLAVCEQWKSLKGVL